MKIRSNRSMVVMLLAGVFALGLPMCAGATAPAPWSVFKRAPVRDAVGNWEGLHGAASSSRGIRVIGASVPLQGNVRLLAIPVAFKADTNPLTSGTGKFPYSTWGPASQPGYLQERLNALTQYYDEVSGHRVNLIPTLTNIVTVENEMAFYAPTNTEPMMQEVVRIADGWINFAQYDIIMLIHAGAGAEGSGFQDNKDIWSHFRSASIPIVTNDGAVIAAWAVVPETQCNDSLFVLANRLEDDTLINIADYERNPDVVLPNPNIPRVIDVLGVWAHEVGHAFGMPDVYDTSENDSGLSLDDWSLMASGSWLPGVIDSLFDPGQPAMGSVPCHPDAWNKKLLGWTTVVNVTDTRRDEAIPAQAASTGRVYRMWTNGNVSSSEYFLLENRTRVGFDRFVPESGLMIYHIDDTAGLLAQNNLQANRDRLRIYPVSADNRIEVINTAPPDDPPHYVYLPLINTAFPGTVNNTHFGAGTAPDSRSYQGTLSFVDVRNIRRQGTFVYADLRTTTGATITFVNPLPEQTIHVTSPTVRVLAPLLQADTLQIFVNDVPVTGFSYTASTGELTIPLGSLVAGAYQVRVSGIDRELDAPVSAAMNFTVAPRVIRAGMRMITLPAQGVGTVANVFNTPAPPRLAWYDPTPGAGYVFYPHPATEFTYAVGAAHPRGEPNNPLAPAGRAFWVELPAHTQILPAGDSLRNDQQYTVPLKQGFNLVGSPYGTPVAFGSLLVEYRGVTYFLDEAARQGLLDPVLYAWNGWEYTLAELPLGTLEPWVGYWIHVRADTSTTQSLDGSIPSTLGLVFQPPTRGRAAASPPPAVKSPVLWQTKLVARNVATQARSTVMLGVSSEATDGLDAGMDLFAPPAPREGISLASRSGQAALLRDLRAPAEQGVYTWDLVVSGEPGAQIVLTWPDLTRVPAHAGVLLRDPVTGDERYLRTVSSYTVQLGGQERERRLTLTVSPGGIGGLQIHQLQAQVTRSTGAVAISCQLTAPASVSVEIRTPTGKVIARIPATTRAQGMVSLHWNGKGANGRALPRGAYLCQVTAVSANGQAARAMTLIQR